MEVDVHCVNVPHIKAEPKYELACERYLDACIPNRFRNVNYPGMRVATHVLREVQPSEIHWREVELAIVREARALARELSTAPPVTMETPVGMEANHE